MAMPAQTQDRQPGREREMHPRPDYTPKYPGVGKLKGKVALITGGDSGIGRAVAVAMAREGAQIAIVYLDEHKDANETRDLVKQEGADALLLPGDAGDETFCEAAVAATIEQFDRLDILVNNAAEQHETKDIREHRRGADRAHLPHQCVQLLLHDQARAAPHEEGREHHQHRLDHRLSGPQDAARLLRHQGRHRHA